MLSVCSSHQTVLSTRRHPAQPVFVLILHLRETQALWSQNYDTSSYVVYRCDRTIGHLTVGDFTVTGVLLFLFALLVSS